MSKADSAGKVILRGARATASGFVVRFGARIGFLFIAARLFGVELFGAYTLAVAAVEVAVTIGGLGSKRHPVQAARGGSAWPQRRACRARRDGDGGHVELAYRSRLHPVRRACAGGRGNAQRRRCARPARPDDRRAGPARPVLRRDALDTCNPLRSRRAQHHRALRCACWRRWPRGGLAGSEEGLLLSYWIGTLAALAYATFGLRKTLGKFEIAPYRFPMRPARVTCSSSARRPRSTICSTGCSRG